MACCEGRFRFCFFNILLLCGILGTENVTGNGTIKNESLKEEFASKRFENNEWTLTKEENAIKGGYHILVGFVTNIDQFKVKELLQTLTIFALNLPVKVFLVPEDTDSDRLLRTKYEIKWGPAILYIANVQKHKVFQDHGLRSKTLEIFLTAQSITVDFSNMENFEAEVLTVTNDFTPVVVCFYATWAEASLTHLSHYKSTTKEFQSQGVKLRWGLIDVSEERTAVGRLINASFAVHVPFTIVFYKSPTSNTVIQSAIALSPSVPSFWKTYARLLDLSINIKGMLGEMSTVVILPRRNYVDEVDVCHPYEGPFGRYCHKVSHNLTESDYTALKSCSLKTQTQYDDKLRKSKNLQTISNNLRLRMSNGIPILTGESWSDVIERSYFTNPLISSERLGRSEVTRVSMVVYIMAGCGSCKNNMPVFTELRSAVSFLGAGDVYLINCTDDSTLCQREGITGFPTITAYRGLNWLGADDCSEVVMAEKYVRMDYHGVIMVDPIMKWYQESTTASVLNLGFEPLPDVMKEDVRLVATLMPIYSQYLPIPPGRDYGYYLPLTCFRFICESLYGQVLCYSIYSSEIPASEFMATSQYIIKEIKMVRRDGVDLTLTQLGRPLLMTLEESESDEDIHKFHTPHPQRYGLKSGFKCEDNHGVCIDAIDKYTRDHARLPVTRMTSKLFHTKNSLFSNNNIPVLIALGHPENLTDNSEFYKILTAVGYKLYNEVIVVTVDVTEYPNWAGQFVPRGFYSTGCFSPPIRLAHHHMSEITDDCVAITTRIKHLQKVGDISASMGKPVCFEENLFSAWPDFESDSPFLQYPRLCLVFWSNHQEAAFFPPLSADDDENLEFQAGVIVQFSRHFLQSPKKLLVPTEHF